MDNHKTALDIIMPVYNTASYLDACISSIVGQTFSDWHLIIVDDGSTDSSPEICDRWAAADNRITVVHKPNTGQSDSRNIAIRMATAELVGFVDSDDWVEPEMYATLIGELRARNADIAVCDHYVDYPRRSRYKKKKRREEVEMIGSDEAQRLIIRDRIQSYVWQMVFKRSLLGEGMPLRMTFEDYAVLPHWFSGARRIVRINRPLYHYRMRQSSIVHEDSAEMELAFVKAEEMRVMFYKNTPFESDANHKLLLTYIRTAKYITRMKNLPPFSLYKYLLDIRHRLNILDNNSTKNLSRKNKLLRFLLLNSISMFIAYQRTEVKLLGNKHIDKEEKYK